MKIEQEPKYDCNELGQLCSRETGSVIPDDEPIFVLRARDKNAIKAINYYAMLCKVDSHQRLALERLGDFLQYSKANPELMREPGIPSVTPGNPVTPEPERPIVKPVETPVAKVTQLHMHSDLLKLGLPIRIVNPLNQNGNVWTVLDLINLRRPELEKVKGVGKIAVDEIVDALSNYGLELRPTLVTKGI